MYDSILTSIKKLLGIAEDYPHFDSDLIMHINTVFMILHQMGVGTAEPFSIEDDTATWQDFLEDKKDLAAVKNYIALKVRLTFDPPTSSSHLQAINDAISEYEWRLYSAESSGNFIPEEGEADGSSSTTSSTRSIRRIIFADEFI